eukprot:COSAG04_NODE_640_length_11672_cov_32.635358_12_plen_106_part_00
MPWPVRASAPAGCHHATVNHSIISLDATDASMRRHHEQALLAKARVIEARREKEEAANTKPEERPTGLFAELAKKEPVRKHSPTPGPAIMSCTFCWEGFGPVLAA